MAEKTKAREKVVKSDRPDSQKAKEKVKAVSRIIFATGKRKRAVARATIKPGQGSVKVNSQPLQIVPNEMLRLKMQEPLILAGDEWKRFDINVDVQGGGVIGQAEAVRQAIAKGLSEALGAEIRNIFLSYDRTLLVADPRRTEPHKPPRSSQGPRRYKQRSKR